jgi:hypothetical protein
MIFFGSKLIKLDRFEDDNNLGLLIPKEKKNDIRGYLRECLQLYNYKLQEFLSSGLGKIKTNRKRRKNNRKKSRKNKKI